MSKSPKASNIANLPLFREFIKEALRLAPSAAGRRQADLARAIGLSPTELSLRLNAQRGRRLSAPDAQAIVRTLATWGALKTAAEVEQMLMLVGSPTLSATEWQHPPFAALTPLSSPSTDLNQSYWLSSPPSGAPDLPALRLRLRELYRQADPYGDGRRPGQRDLASAIGLAPTELSKRLNGTDGRQLSAIDVRAIVRTLASWGAITTRAEAEELLTLMAASNFSTAEWAAPPLDELAEVVANPTPHNLPRLLTSFIGREQELAEGKQLISQNPLLTLMGSGGIGKTRLSLELGHQLLAQFKDGVYFVALDALADPALVPQIVAQTLGCREESGQRIAATLIHFIGRRRPLLILDNCEHLTAAVALLVKELLGNCPNLVILATSRQPLGVSGEQIWQLSPLSVPPRPNLPPATLADYDSVKLFVAHAQLAWSGFELSEQNGASVAEICRWLDGIPLALEMVAALVRAMSVAQIASRLAAQFGLLRRDSAHLPTRQQTLRASIMWSYSLLNPTEQTLLRRLATFNGGFELEAAEAICADENLPATSVAGLLVALVNKSLVTTISQGNAMRYGMLQTIHEFAAQMLTESDEDTLLRQRHAQLYLALSGEFAATNLTELSRWRSRLEPELDNIRAALDWGRDHDANLAAHLALNLDEFWTIRSYPQEAYQIYASIEELPELAASPRLQLIRRLTSFHGNGVDHTIMDRYLEQGIALARTLSDHELLARLYNGRGGHAVLRSDMAAARRDYQTALNMALTIGNKDLVASARGNLAGIAMDEGDYAAARRGHEQNLPLRRELGEQRMIAYTHLFIAEAALAMDDCAAAAEQYNEAQRIFRENGDPKGVAVVEYGKAELAKIVGDYALARERYQSALPEMRERGYAIHVAAILTGLAELALVEGNASQADAYAAEAVQILAPMNAIWYTVRAYTSIAKSWLLATSDWQRVASLLAVISRLLRETGIQLLPYPRRIYEQMMVEYLAASARANLESAWARGEAMSLEQANAYVQRQFVTT